MQYKSEFAKYSKAEVISYAEHCIENTRLNPPNISGLTEAFDLIKITEDGLREESEDQSYSENYLFFKELKKFEEIHREKRKWMSYDQLNEIKIMLEKYPDRHSLIWKVLKLSRSTYKRLLIELEKEKFNQYKSKRQIRFRNQISELEKKCFEFWVVPPRSPITITSI